MASTEVGGEPALRSHVDDYLITMLGLDHRHVAGDLIGQQVALGYLLQVMTGSGRDPRD
jgi:hypothetical protein